MITNDFFKGYFQALNMVDDLVNNLKEEQTSSETLETLDSISLAIKGIRTSYQDLIVKLNRDMNETK